MRRKQIDREIKHVLEDHANVHHVLMNEHSWLIVFNAFYNKNRSGLRIKRYKDGESKIEHIDKGKVVKMINNFLKRTYYCARMPLSQIL